ncbi:MAG: bifunctional 3-deoxy-7-phosphoheptulonate synthase/chorismate mutase type II [Bacteroidales bacterium]|nr:bifunctional 3-deoxy-7-phosphoheptulonate synthase/chorismate mutase type II [Bacteroidales bacterium]
MHSWKLSSEEGAIPLIAGPCSAESEGQLMRTAEGLSSLGVKWFRAGLWKPRTHPGSFEGVGPQGLPWLLKVREQFGMMVGAEVAGPRQVEECLEAGLDFLWIGARTTASPFLVQETASALEGVGDSVPIFIKNPLSPDVGLWMGAVERLDAAGVGRIGLIHRGFTPSSPSVYRNDPNWNAAVQMRTGCPDVPFLADPSHMGGAVRFVREISQKALDLGFDGLMLEIHESPSEALSDSAQQITAPELETLLKSLTVRSSGSEDEGFNSVLEQLRSRIDAIDDGIIGLLAERMEVSRRIGRVKKEHSVSILQTSRWESVLASVVRKGRAYGLDERFLKEVFNAVHKASVESQQD